MTFADSVGNLRRELMDLMKSQRLMIVADFRDEWGWQVIGTPNTPIQFKVYIGDTEFHVETGQDPRIKTADTELVIQAAKAFKSKFNC